MPNIPSCKTIAKKISSPMLTVVITMTLKKDMCIPSFSRMYIMITCVITVGIIPTPRPRI